MAQQVIDETATTGADPASVYALLADGSTWPEWSPLGSFELIAAGDGTPEGLGAVRLFTTGRHKSRERVVTCQPGEVFAYELEAGLPLRDYKAVITLTPTAGGTAINWRSTFRPKVPGTGWLYRRELGNSSGGPSEGLAAAADRARSSYSGRGRRWRRPRRRSSRPPRGSRRPGGAGRATPAGPARPHPRRPRSPSSRAPRPSMARRAWKSWGGVCER